MVSSDKLLHTLRGDLECVQFALVVLRLRGMALSLGGVDRISHGREHVLKLSFKTSIYIGLLGLIHIKVDRKNHIFASIRPRR
jgi:hypothetical protein